MVDGSNTWWTRNKTTKKKMQTKRNEQINQKKGVCWLKRKSNREKNQLADGLGKHTHSYTHTHTHTHTQRTKHEILLRELVTSLHTKRTIPDWGRASRAGAYHSTQLQGPHRTSKAGSKKERNKNAPLSLFYQLICAALNVDLIYYQLSYTHRFEVWQASTSRHENPQKS